MRAREALDLVSSYRLEASTAESGRGVACRTGLRLDSDGDRLVEAMGILDDPRATLPEDSVSESIASGATRPTPCVASPTGDACLIGQVAFGPRVPPLMFGGHVTPGIDSRWCSYASVPKTVLQLLGLPALGVPRADDDPGLGDLVDPAMAPVARPPAHAAKITIPPLPSPTRRARAPRPA